MNTLAQKACALIFITGLSCAQESTFIGGDAQGPTSSDVNTQPEKKGVGIPEGFDKQSGVLTFEASKLVEASFDLNLNRLEASTEFSLENEYSDKTEMHKQKSRNKRMQLATQGTDGMLKVDLFDQTKDRGAVDILLVVDNSRSMKEEHQNLSTKLSSLLAKIEDTRWHIGITSTDVSDGCDIDVINYKQADAVDRFKQQINKLGTNGDGNEQGIYRAVNGLTCNGSNWLRDDAVLAILFVSDEDNCSRQGSGCRPEAWSNISFLTDYIENDLGREIGADTGFYGIFWHPDQNCQTGENRGYQYKELINYKAEKYNVSAASRWGSICSSNYSSTLESISQGISYQLDTSWELTAPPEPGSLMVSIILDEGTEVDVDQNAYSLKGSIITFEANTVPPLGSQIKASYVTGKTPKFEKVALDYEAATETIEVFINEQPLDKNDYMVSDNNIIFSQAPEDNAKVRITYKENMPLDKTYRISGTPKKADQIRVTINDEDTTDFNYNALTRDITFTNPPNDGAEVAIMYVNIDGPKLSYMVPFAGDNPRNFALYDGDRPIDFELTDLGEIIIKSSEHEDGKTLVLTYDVDNEDAQVFTLPHEPIKDSLKVETNADFCNQTADYILDGYTVKSACKITEDLLVILQYNYLDSRREFSIPGDLDLSRQDVEVLINGARISSFTISGTLLGLKETPEIGAKVELRYGLQR
jgi:hypothetical protein